MQRPEERYFSAEETAKTKVLRQKHSQEQQGGQWAWNRTSNREEK